MKVEFEGVTHEFPDDFTDEEVQKALSSAPQAAPQPQVMPGAGAAATRPLMNQLSQGLPAAGGMLGGLVPGPAGIPAAGGLQAAGEGLRQLVSGEGLNAGGIAREGAKGAGYAALGGTAAKVVGGVARGAFAIGGKVSHKIAKTLMKHGVNVSEGRLGLEKLEKVSRRFGDDAKKLYAEADAQVGPTMPVTSLTDPIRELAKKLPNKSERAAFERMATKFDKDHPAYVSPSVLRIMKQRAQNLVSYSSDKIGPRTQEFQRTIAGVARAKLTSLGQVGKKIEAADRELGQLKDARRALRKVGNRVPGAGAGMARHVAGAIDHPQLYSTLALLLNSARGPVNQLTRAAGNVAFPPIVEE